MKNSIITSIVAVLLITGIVIGATFFYTDKGKGDGDGNENTQSQNDIQNETLLVGLISTNGMGNPQQSNFTAIMDDGSIYYIVLEANQNLSATNDTIILNDWCTLSIDDTRILLDLMNICINETHNPSSGWDVQFCKGGALSQLELDNLVNIIQNGNYSSLNETYDDYGPITDTPASKMAIQVNSTLKRITRIAASAVPEDYQVLASNMIELRKEMTA